MILQRLILVLLIVPMSLGYGILSAIIMIQAVLYFIATGDNRFYKIIVRSSDVTCEDWKALYASIRD